MFKHNTQRAVSLRTVSSRSKWHLASLLLLGAGLCAASGQARAEDDPGALKNRAVAGQVGGAQLHHGRRGQRQHRRPGREGAPAAARQPCDQNGEEDGEDQQGDEHQSM